MPVELRELKWAIVVSQHRSLHQAAATLNVQQSTLSRSLRAMESRLGAELFERTNGGTRPTTAGLEFLASARRIIAETDAAVRNLRTRSRGEMGKLTIGVYASPSAGNLHATLVEHHRRFPEVQIQTMDGDHEHLLFALTSRVVDIAIMTKCHPVWGGRTLPLWSERVILALPEHHLLDRSNTIRWTELVDERLLLTRKRSA